MSTRYQRRQDSAKQRQQERDEVEIMPGIWVDLAERYARAQPTNPMNPAGLLPDSAMRGAGETGLMFGSAAVGELAAVPAILMQATHPELLAERGIHSAADARDRVSEKFTYQPRTEEGQAQLEEIGGAITFLGEKILPAREAYERNANALLGPQVGGALYAGTMALASVLPVGAVAKPGTVAGGAVKNALIKDVPDLERVGVPIKSRIDADRRWAEGDDIYAFNEMDEMPSKVTSVEMLNAYTPDQLIAVDVPYRPMTGQSRPMSDLYPDQRGGPAWHGTPHKFDKFELEKIGTGEGAQAYGHGLYFAENPGVARSYQNQLADMGKFDEWLSVRKNKEAWQSFVQNVQLHHPNLPVAEFDSLGEFKRIQSGKAPLHRIDGEVQEAIRDADELKLGHLYEVDIPDETIGKMLDWDAPLSEQPELQKIADRFKLTDNNLSVGFYGDGTTVDPSKISMGAARPVKSGEEFYMKLAEELGSEEAASKYLNEAGIPGIRYYDGSSRGKGEGTRNIVVFNPDDIREVKRDGELVHQASGVDMDLLEVVGKHDVNIDRAAMDLQDGRPLRPAKQEYAEPQPVGNKQRGSIDNTKTPEVNALAARVTGRTVATPDEHRLQIDRDTRATKNVRALSPVESNVISSSVPKPRRTAVAAAVRRAKANYPKSEGWAPVTLKRVKEIKAKDGSVKYEAEYQGIPYGFARDKNGDLLKPADDMSDEIFFERGGEYEQRRSMLVKNLVKEIEDVKARAAKGDTNAQVIMRQSEWYKGMRRELREKYGGMGDLFADLLGALSPQTDVATNYRYAAQALEQFTKGKWRNEVKQFIEHLDGGGSVKSYKGPVPLQESGKKFGINSENMMLAMADLWRVIEPGTAPKARNFSGNLIGLTDAATIDVWAARFLDRMSGSARIPPPAEMAVQGVWKADMSGPGGEFGLGQEVFAEAAKQLGMSPDDLQAVAWFREKELWGQKSWTTKSGEGGSFEAEAVKNPSERSLAGLSTDRPDAPATAASMRKTQDSIWQALSADPDIKAVKVEPTVGMYMGDKEPSFDIELVTTPDHDPAVLFNEVARVAKESNQESAFVSRVITSPDVDSTNVRPGLEVYFGKSTDVAGAETVMARLRELGVDGFTVIKDPRGSVVGVRYQYVPEFDVMYGGKSLDDLDNLIQSQRDLLSDVIDEVSGLDNISHAEIMDYDTVVMTGKNYDDFIGTGENRLRDSAGKTWPQRSVRESVEAALRGTRQTPATGSARPGSNALIGGGR